VTALRQQVERLEDEVGALRRERGVGGAGEAGGEQLVPEGPVTLATATFQGTVRAVTPRRIYVFDPESGSIYDLVIDRQTRVFEDGERIRPQQLEEGTPVRTSLALISTGESRARDVVVLERQARPRQGAQQPRPGSQRPRSGGSRELP
jgi:hypothetical protein